MNQYYLDKLEQYQLQLGQVKYLDVGPKNDYYIKIIEHNLEVLTDRNTGVYVCYSSKLKDCQSSFERNQQKLIDFETDLLNDLSHVLVKLDKNNNTQVIIYPNPIIDGKTWFSQLISYDYQIDYEALSYMTVSDSTSKQHLIYNQEMNCYAAKEIGCQYLIYPNPYAFKGYKPPQKQVKIKVDEVEEEEENYEEEQL